LRVQNYSNAIAREQGQKRFYAGVGRKFSVFNQEDFLHCRNCCVRFARQHFDGPLLLRKDLDVHRVIDHGQHFAKNSPFGLDTAMVATERRFVRAVQRLYKPREFERQPDLRLFGALLHRARVIRCAVRMMREADGAAATAFAVRYAPRHDFGSANSERRLYSWFDRCIAIMQHTLPRPLLMRDENVIGNICNAIDAKYGAAQLSAEPHLSASR